MRLQLARLAAAVLTTAAAGLGLVVGTSAPATAAACSGATGVTVVVDHGALGGGVEVVCNPSAGGKASSLFTGSGFALTYVQRTPGFVCRIIGQPASDPCVNTPPTNAYWGLFWSDGKSGSWSYSSLGAGSLTVPDGGYVAFAWQTGSQNAPNVAPTPHPSNPPPAPTPTPTPTTGSGGGGHANGGGGHGGTGPATPTVKPSAKPSAKPSSKPPATSAASVAPTVTPTAPPSGDPTTSSDSPGETGSATAGPVGTPTVAPSDSSSAAATPSESSSAAPVDAPDASGVDTAGALPAWVVPVVLLALVAGGAAYLLHRRHRASP
jgi:hypothetical protein